MEMTLSPLSSRPERSAVEGSAVPRTPPGNVFSLSRATTHQAQKHHLEAVCGAAGLSVISALPTHAVLPLSHWGSMNSHPTRFCSASACTVPLAIRVLRL